MIYKTRSSVGCPRCDEEIEFMARFDVGPGYRHFWIEDVQYNCACDEAVEKIETSSHHDLAYEAFELSQYRD